MKRDSFVFYRGYYEALSLISNPKVRAELALAIIEYGVNGEISEELGETVRVAMALIRPQMDANNRRYANGCKGAEMGKRGGRPRKVRAGGEAADENPGRGAEKPQENPKETPNDNENVNENVNDNEDKEYPPTSDKERAATGVASVAAAGGVVGVEDQGAEDPLIEETLAEVRSKAGRIAEEERVGRGVVEECAREVAAAWRLTGEFDRRRPVTHMIRTVLRKLRSGEGQGAAGRAPVAAGRRLAAEAAFRAERAAERAAVDEAMAVDSAAELRAYMMSCGLKPGESVVSAVGNA